MSGGKLDDDDLKELETLSDKSDLTIWQRLKLAMHSLVHSLILSTYDSVIKEENIGVMYNLLYVITKIPQVQKAGFVGILLCASIPNPLFDLAGITCGHFLVPFTTFFGATLIGESTCLRQKNYKIVKSFKFDYILIIILNYIYTFCSSCIVFRTSYSQT